MPTLLLDIGNTRLKWGWLDETMIHQQGAIEHREQPWSLSLSLIFTTNTYCKRILISSVLTDQRNQELESALGMFTQAPVNWAKSNKECLGVVNAYSNPGSLGVDRWLALVASHHLENGPKCVVDCGSAITVDALSPDGHHLGGAILPGFIQMRQSLCEGTALKLDELPATPPLFGKNTGDGVASGMIYAVAGLINQFKLQLFEKYDENVLFVLTGGDVAQILPIFTSGIIDAEHQHIPDLVLRGLALWGNDL